MLQPLIERIEADVMASDLLHADDTPIRVLDRASRDKGLGKGVKKGRIWGPYVRDQRPWARRVATRGGLCLRAGLAGKTRPSPSGPDPRHPPRPTDTRGMPSSMTRALTGRPAYRRPHVGPTCGATSHDEWGKTKSAIAREALDRIGALYDIERELTGRSADIRLAARQKHSARGCGFLRLVRAAARADPGQGRSGQGLPLWPQPKRRLQPLP